MNLDRAWHFHKFKSNIENAARLLLIGESFAVQSILPWLNSKLYTSQLKSGSPNQTDKNWFAKGPSLQNFPSDIFFNFYDVFLYFYEILWVFTFFHNFGHNESWKSSDYWTK